MIWKIRFWNMKKIGKKKINVPDMITTFRAFATSVRELKTKQFMRNQLMKMGTICVLLITGAINEKISRHFLVKWTKTENQSHEE